MAKQVPQATRARALALTQHRCFACGKGGRLHIHHLDGRGISHPDVDNSLANLLPLCPHCHVAVHKGRLNGRLRRLSAEITTLRRDRDLALFSGEGLRGALCEMQARYLLDVRSWCMALNPTLQESLGAEPPAELRKRRRHRPVLVTSAP